MKNNKKKKYVGSFIFLLLVGVAFAIGYGTYAIYQSSAQGSDVTLAAKWKVKVNGSNIVNQDVFSLKGQTVGIGEPLKVQLLVDAEDSQTNVAYKITKGVIDNSGFRNEDTAEYSYVDFSENSDGNSVLVNNKLSITGIHLYEWNETERRCSNTESSAIGGILAAGSTVNKYFCVSIGETNTSYDANSWVTENNSNDYSSENNRQIDSIDSLPLVVIARQTNANADY